MEESTRATVTMPALSAMVRAAEEENRICCFQHCPRPHRADFEVPDVLTMSDRRKQLRKYELNELDHWIVVETG